MNIIFDFDGVILNSHKIKTLAFHNIFKVYGEKNALKAKKIHLKNVGKSRYFKFKFILKNILKIQLTKKKLSFLDKKFDNFIKKKIKKIEPSNYLIKFLKKKNNKVNFYVSTATPQEKITKILKEKNLLKYFKKVYGSPSTKKEHIRKIIKNKQMSIFIGDSYEDFKAANDSKIKFILKINSENLSIRKKNVFNTINSFKYLEKKIQLIKKL